MVNAHLPGSEHARRSCQQHSPPALGGGLVDKSPLHHQQGQSREQPGLNPTVFSRWELRKRGSSPHREAKGWRRTRGMIHEGDDAWSGTSLRGPQQSQVCCPCLLLPAAGEASWKRLQLPGTFPSSLPEGITDPYHNSCYFSSSLPARSLFFFLQNLLPGK